MSRDIRQLGRKYLRLMKGSLTMQLVFPSNGRPVETRVWVTQLDSRLRRRRLSESPEVYPFLSLSSSLHLAENLFPNWKA